MAETKRGRGAKGGQAPRRAAAARAGAGKTAARRPGKNIVLCSDGTGNRGGKARGTNVWALFCAVWRHPDADGKLPERTQITFYDDGVGTQDFIAFKILGGAFGWGYSRNTRDLYRALVSAYDPGDSIYLFGFSRGAYTVRALAGLILKQGILDRDAFATSAELDRAVKAVFRAYRQGYGSVLDLFARLLRPRDASTYTGYLEDGRIHDLDADGRPASRVHFVGVWDTVDAVGLPVDELADGLDLIARFRFRDQNLHPNVDRACHAVSIDDERHTFWPVMWNEVGDRDPSRIEQVWFPGVHSNVGGGYPKDEMAMVSLDWMMERASAAGLLFYKDLRAGVRQAANAHGRLYDSRSGLAAYYRYKPRRMAAVCDDAAAGVRIERPKLHFSALRRAARATDGYAPAHLAQEVEVVATHPADAGLVGRLAADHAATAAERADALKPVGRLVRLRVALHYLFVAYSLALLGAAAWFYWRPAEAAAPGDGTGSPIGWLIDAVEWVLPDFVLGFVGPLLQQARVHWIAALAAAAALAALAGLKALLEARSRHLARDAWAGFRRRAYPPGGAAPGRPD